MASSSRYRAETRPSSEGLGVYLHIPFCSRRCDYCAFATFTDRAHLIEAYVEACRTDIRRARDAGRLTPAATLFVGGGTPSLLPGELLAGLIDEIELLPGAEATVECNPESTSPELLAALREAGVTRISLGVQSLVPGVLAALGRSHSPGAVTEAVAAIGTAGIGTFNVDLIYGGADESDDDWVTTLEGVLALDPRPTHVSAYALTIEAGTPLALDTARHPDDDIQADRYAICDTMLTEAGYGWYEISNWAQPGHECRHNRACWRGGEYLGFGSAAHSHFGGDRFFNVRTPDRYIERIAEGRSPVAGNDKLSKDGRQLERLELMLRTREGVPREALLAEPALEGLTERSGNRVALTLSGRLLANEVALRLRVPPAREAQNLTLRDISAS